MSGLDDSERDDFGRIARGDLGRLLAERFEAESREREAIRQAEANDPFGPMPFLPISSASRILHVIERCMCMRRNGLVLGAPGVGKSMALAEAKRRSDAMEGPEVAVLKVEPAYGGSAMVLLEELAPLLNVEPGRSVADTVRRLKRDVYFRPVVLFDEAQNLSLRLVHQLLSISEDTDVRMVFVGNPEAVKLVNSQLADVRLVSRRLPYRDTIDGISDDDAVLVAQHFQVEGWAAFQLCQRIGAVFHMDGIVEVLREARRQAGSVPTLRLEVVRSAIDAFPQFVAGLAQVESRPSRLRQRSAAALPSSGNLNARRGGARHGSLS